MDRPGRSTQALGELHLAAQRQPEGRHLENLVLTDLLAWRETRIHRPNLLFWRTAKGAEVDLVIETPTALLLPIEIKSSDRLSTADARHVQIFLDEYPEWTSAGSIIYTGSETYWLTNRVLAIPWRSICGSG